jgi:hypothetical protein
MLVYWIDFGMSNMKTSAAWRVPTILQTFFLIIQLLLLPLVPDTARWYAAHDQSEKSLMVLQRLYDGAESDEYIQALHADIVQTVAVEASLGAGTWRDVFKSDSICSRQRLFLACGIQIMQQLGGNTAILCMSSIYLPKRKSPDIYWLVYGLLSLSSNKILIYLDYGNTLFENSLGFTAHKAGLMSGYLNTFFFVTSFVPWFLIDRIGRRPLVSIIPLISNQYCEE